MPNNQLSFSRVNNRNCSFLASFLVKLNCRLYWDYSSWWWERGETPLLCLQRTYGSPPVLWNVRLRCRRVFAPKHSEPNAAALLAGCPLFPDVVVWRGASAVYQSVCRWFLLMCVVAALDASIMLTSWWWDAACCQHSLKINECQTHLLGFRWFWFSGLWLDKVSLRTVWCCSVNFVGSFWI